MPNITYVRVGDYLLPSLVLSEPPDAEPLNRYGMMRKAFLKQHQPITYGRMLLSEQLYPHCRDVGRNAESQFETLMAQLTERDPPPDKAVDGIAWATHMNTLRHTAEEIVLAQTVYDNSFI